MNIKINQLSIAVSLALAISSNIWAQGNPHDNISAPQVKELSPEELDKRFTKKDYDDMRARYSDEIIVQDNSFVNKMSKGSNLVITGEIIDQSYTYDSFDAPSTQTTIQILTVLKGEYPSDKIVLTRRGGLK